MATDQDEISEEKQESILKELCISNGIQYSQLEGNGPNVKELEMFFSGYPYMVGLQHFVHLTTLVIVGQSIKLIQNLHHCPELRELWACECELTKIQGLEKVKRLSKLMLYGNKLHKIENISHLHNLDVLNLSRNKIQEIEGIDNLKWLKELNLAGNSIPLIGTSLQYLHQLQILNLSGNKLSSFKDLTNLTKLPKLNDLSLKDSLYPNNPVCLLCNYSTHVLYHLPNLERLDTYDVSAAQMRELAEVTVMKKKMYYNMRVKTVRRNLTTLLNRLQKEKRLLLQIPEERLRAFNFALKSIEQQQQNDETEDSSSDSSSPSPEIQSEAKVELAAGEAAPPSDGKDTEVEPNKADQFNNKLSSLQARIEAWKKRTQEMETYHKQSVDLLHHLSDTSFRRLTIELETGGNVRFEQGAASDVWYTTCHDLVLSRFCAWDYRAYGVTGIKMHGITRVNNRVLRARFDDKVHSIAAEENGTVPKNYKKLVDYLFFVWNPKRPSSKQLFNRILEEGFGCVLNSGPSKEAIPLSNSLFICEKPRLEHLIDSCKGQEFADPFPFRHGQVIVSKVYLGKSAPAQGNAKITSDRYYKINSVYKPRKEGEKEVSPIKDDCECSTRQCEWFVFDPDLVLPEYIINFEYFGKKPVSPFQFRVGDWLNTGVVGSTTMVSTSPPSDHTSLFSSEETKDSESMSLPPQVRLRPRLVSLSEELLLKLGRTMSLTQITILNLHGNGLGRLKGINSLSQLRHLVVSFNELTRLEDVAHMSHLEVIDASFNKINSLEGMRGMTKLRELNLSWNQLTSLRDDLTVLRKHSTSLNTLDLRNNPWIKAEFFFLRVIGRLKSLTLLNGTQVTESDAAAALRLVAGTRISQTTLGAHSRTDSDIPNSLSLQSQAQILTQLSKNKPDMKDPGWMAKVTVLNLDGQFIGKLVGLERLENLCWASFDRNCVTKLEGIECCTKLEELSLQDNCIYKLDGLSKLTKLRHLDLTSNYLSSVENVGFEKLSSLLFLSLENNRLTSFKGLSGAGSLVELYIGNNRVSNIREVFQLKTLPSLVILDLYGNPVAQSDNYRLFIIYHLQALKALDGNAIENSEEGNAKDAFGGRLTNDFVAERIGHANFQDIREIDFPNCSVRTVDIGSGELFKNLRSVNLEHNSLTSFSGLIHLRHVRVLCLNHNHIESVLPRPRNHKQQQIRSQYAVSHQVGVEVMAQETLTPVMESLEVLHIGYNRINNMAALQLGRLVNLKALFVQGNEISRIEGLEGLHELRELVLDRNKVKAINENSFVSQWNLLELHVEENRLRDLSNLHHLENLQRFYLGMNRIQDMMELEKLETLPNLLEVSVIGNAVSRRLLHRPMLVFQQPNLQTIDGIPVTPEERTKAELYFMDQKPVVAESILPGITPHNRAGPIKVTHMSIGNERHAVPYAPGHDDDGYTRGKRNQGRDKSTHHSMTHGALYNQLAGIKYNQQQQSITRPYGQQQSPNNRNVGSANRYR
nr:leucine-rich repeat-containing protein 9-like [Ciona intestinalis]|eukprot:XP_002121920.1 leucine-rich repeat-containing protein 9-like [Ciona intestinalis]